MLWTRIAVDGELKAITAISIAIWPEVLGDTNRALRSTTKTGAELDGYCLSKRIVENSHEAIRIKYARESQESKSS